MIYNYFNHWVSSWNKRGKTKLIIEEVQNRFKNKELFYILAGDEIKPDYIIYYQHDLIVIKKLNNNLDSILEMYYTINNDEFFLSSVIIHEYDLNNAKIKQSVTFFATIKDYNEGDHIREILEKPLYKIFDYKTEKEESWENLNVTDKETLFRKYPKFWDWDWLIDDIESMEKAI